MSELLTVSEVAATLKVSPQSVRRWVTDGTLPAVKLPRHIRVSRDDLEAFLNERRKNGAEVAA